MTSEDQKQWFFVSHLEERDRPSNEMRYEIQVLNEAGLAIARGYVDDRLERLEIEGKAVPLPVIKAARKQAIGKGDYVNESGDPTAPY